jgi:hypothetical protein
MLEDRNLTAHVYKEKYADEIYSRVPQYLDLFKKLIDKLRQTQI